MKTQHLSLVFLVISGAICLVAAFLTKSAPLEVIGLTATLGPLAALLSQDQPTTHQNLPR